MAKNKLSAADVTEDPHYHDTWTLLRKYRDVVWSLEVSVRQVRNRFRIDYGKTIEDFLESVYLAGADLSGTELEHQAKCIEQSHKMLCLVDSAVDLMRAKHKNGEIEAQIRARYEAKKAKNFAEADRIREALKAAGVEVTDVPGGAKWKRI